MAITGHFEGHADRECGDHRTVGAHRAWCFGCSEWCYPVAPCRGCELPALRTEITKLRTHHQADIFRLEQWRTDVTTNNVKLRAEIAHADALLINTKRNVIAALEAKKHMVCEDGWYTCPAATEERDGGICFNDDLEGDPCDCGHAARIAAMRDLLGMTEAV